MQAFADALERGDMSPQSSSATLQTVLGISQQRLRQYKDAALAAPNTDDLVLALRTAAASLAKAAENQPHIEVAWTYPGQSQSGLRTTGGVAREMISASLRSILVVGYAVTVDSEFASLASQTITAMSRAAERGVAVTIVLHRLASRDAITRAWRPGVPRPDFYTWPRDNEDGMTSIHAKLLVVDRTDALVTSANLTRHGFEKNLEMGIRVTGAPASEIHDSIQMLIAAADLVPWR